jgi:hypothetical protein
LNHQPALRCKIENWRGPLPATGRSNRGDNETLPEFPHRKE